MDRNGHRNNRFASLENQIGMNGFLWLGMHNLIGIMNGEINPLFLFLVKLASLLGAVSEILAI